MSNNNSTLGVYRDAVFKAIMWSQAVENLVRDYMMKCVANSRLSFSDKTIRKIKDEFGLGWLVKNSSNCFSEDLKSRLFSFSKERNELAHRAADLYMTNCLVGMSREEMAHELWKLEEITRSAGNLYGELLQLHN